MAKVKVKYIGDGSPEQATRSMMIEEHEVEPLLKTGLWAMDDKPSAKAPKTTEVTDG